MKKFQSFEDVANYLSLEEVPFTDRKNEIMKNIDARATGLRTSHRKLTLVFTAILILITSVAFAYDRIYGYIKRHEIFVEAHDGKINEVLTDDRGNIVVQVGTMSRERHEELENEHMQRPTQSNEFKTIYEELEKELPEDKLALFIPVKDLESFSDFVILNNYRRYDTFEEFKEKLPSGSPIPNYIPEGFEFIKSDVTYSHEYIFELDYNYLKTLFEEAKSEGKDYYYKEFTNLNRLGSYSIDYRGNISLADEKMYVPSIHMIIKKGETTNLYVKDPDEVFTEVIEYKGRSFLREHIKKEDSYCTYYTYMYIDDELWTISISTGLSVEEVAKIVESIE